MTRTADFMGFMKLYESVPDIDALIAKPDAADVPSDPAVLYAICAALSARASKGNVSNVIKYLSRIPQKEFAAFALKDAVNRDGGIKQVEAFRKWVMADGRSLML